MRRFKPERFSVKWRDFAVEYVHPAIQLDAANPNGRVLLGLIKHEQEWALYLAVYQTKAARGRLKVKRAQQRPHWKRLGYFKTKKAAKAFAKEYRG